MLGCGISSRSQPKRQQRIHTVKGRTTVLRLDSASHYNTFHTSQTAEVLDTSRTLMRNSWILYPPPTGIPQLMHNNCTRCDRDLRICFGLWGNFKAWNKRTMAAPQKISLKQTQSNPNHTVGIRKKETLLETSPSSDLRDRPAARLLGGIGARGGSRLARKSLMISRVPIPIL